MHIVLSVANAVQQFSVVSEFVCLQSLELPFDELYCVSSFLLLKRCTDRLSPFCCEDDVLSYALNTDHLFETLSKACK